MIRQNTQVNHITGYLRGVIEEIKKIKWPTKAETKRLTIYVVGVSLIVGLLVSGMDFLFQKVLALILALKAT